jgi:hypothetical protein
MAPTEKAVTETFAETQPVVLTQKQHQYDPNLPQEKLDELLQATEHGDLEAVDRAKANFIDDSPYEAVRAAVKPIDGEEPACTVRAWILGLTFVTLGSGANMFLSMRSPAINFPPIIVLL